MASVEPMADAYTLTLRFENCIFDKKPYLLLQDAVVAKSMNGVRLITASAMASPRIQKPDWRHGSALSQQTHMNHRLVIHLVIHSASIEGDSF